VRGVNIVKLSKTKINIFISIIYGFDSLVKHMLCFVKGMGSFYSVRQFDNLTAFFSHPFWGVNTLRFKASPARPRCFRNRGGGNGLVVQLLPLIDRRIDGIFDVIHLKNRPLLDWPQRGI
jgi:hypothetical protein